MSFRIKCFLSHLLISVVIAILAIILIFFVWYPKPFASAVGVGSLVIIMLGVDIIIGPILTLVLAKKGKKGLKFDFIVIAILQLSALVYGLFYLERGRPVWIAFDVNRFDLVQSFALYNHDQAEPQFKQKNWADPKFVTIRPARNDQEYKERADMEFEGKSVIGNLNLYQPIDDNIEYITKSKKPLSQLYKTNEPEKVKNVLASYPKADSYFVMFAAEKSKSILFDSKENKLLAVVDLRPKF